MLDAVREAARPEMVQGNHRLGTPAQGLAQLPVLAVGAEEGSDDKFRQARGAGLVGGGVRPQLDVQPERLAVCLVLESYQVELPADRSGNRGVLESRADALRKDLEGVEGRRNIGALTERDEPRIPGRGPYRELVPAPAEKARQAA